MIEGAVLRGSPLRAAVATLEETRRLIAVVVESNGRLTGTISDGDVRRALLRGLDLSSAVEQVMNSSPIVADSAMGTAELADFLLSRGVAAAPVVDGEGRVLRVVQARDFELAAGDGQEVAGFACAVIMAGGEGRRLRPLTENRPKPMILIGGVPLLERHIRRMVDCGILQIHVSTNYLGHIIEDFLGDGATFGAAISYLREKVKLGTAGALSLLEERPDGTLLVINGDVVTSSDYSRLHSFHVEAGAAITVGAVSYHVEIPFGVLRIDGHRVSAVEEKPTQRFLCNAGIYAVEPHILDLVPRNTMFDMTDLIKAALARGERITAFPIHEYWNDIGTPSDLEQAKQDNETI